MLNLIGILIVLIVIVTTLFLHMKESKHREELKRMYVHAVHDGEKNE